MKTITDLVLHINLISSAINVILYAYRYRKVSIAEVDGNLVPTKRALLFQFLSMMIVTSTFASVFCIVLFDPIHTEEALYILNFALLVLNVTLLINAFLISRASKSK